MKITANKYTPYFPIHPSEIIKDEIEYRSMPQSRLASQMGISYTLLNVPHDCIVRHVGGFMKTG